MTQGLYIAEVHGKDVFSKPGITEDIGSRCAGYEKGGNSVTINFLCIAHPGLDRKIITLENDGKAYFKKYFSKFNGFNRSEYISIADTGLTPDKLETFYRAKIAATVGIYIVKKEYLDQVRENNFMETALKYPEKYFEGFEVLDKKRKKAV